MDNKGFTLIELMAVVTILVILSLIIIPIVDKNVKRSKNDMYNVQIENIRIAGEVYFSDNIVSRPDLGNYCSISVDLLKSEGYIGGNVVDPRTDKPFENLYVQIKNSGITTDNFDYYVCPIESECESVNQSCR